MTEALTLWQQILIDVLFPPVGVSLWWLMSRATAYTLQSGNPTQRSLDFIRRSTLVLLVICYCLMFGITAYAHFSRRASK
jgi:hypothetical protein